MQVMDHGNKSGAKGQVHGLLTNQLRRTSASLQTSRPNKIGNQKDYWHHAGTQECGAGA
ncbi:hypothetical protein DP46_6048 [Burkholderia phage BEK]|uniref:Uncharacterized protein n=1 Tax=Burkholderia phage BEK TaxID=1514988 RepID=A0A4P1QFK7_9CAUD|nr:hypothetical protein DP46_6048 [Burkholderia phage BEK]